MTSPAPFGVPTPNGDPRADDVEGLFSLLVATAQLLTARYPKKLGAFERVVQLAEETGEVAEQINIWAGTGRKREKHGEFDPQDLAAELADVMRVAAGIAVEFGIVGVVGNQIRAQHIRALRRADAPRGP